MLNLSGVELFNCYTLVDITYTGVIRSEYDIKLRNQQRNYETLLQIVGLHTQPDYV